MESAHIEAPLFDFLSECGIATQTYRHAPVFTVAEAKAVRAADPGLHKGGHAKSLFVRDKKKRRALVMIGEDTRVDLKSLAPQIGLGRLSFGSAESLKKMLGVVPGSVTPFALVNARENAGSGEPLVVALDNQLMRHSMVFFHPLHNAATTAITPEGLRAFIKACGYTPIELNLSQS